MQYLKSLVSTGALHEPLAEIVAVLVDHELVHVVEALVDAEIDDLRARFREYFLQLLAPLLRPRQRNNFAAQLGNGLELRVVKFVEALVGFALVLGAVDDWLGRRRKGGL